MTGFAIRSLGAPYFALSQPAPQAHASGGSEFTLGLGIRWDGTPEPRSPDPDDNHTLFAWYSLAPGLPIVLSVGITSRQQIRVVVAGTEGFPAPQERLTSGFLPTAQGFVDLQVTFLLGSGVIMVSAGGSAGGAEVDAPVFIPGAPRRFMLFNSPAGESRAKVTIREASFGDENGGYEWVDFDRHVPFALRAAGPHPDAPTDDPTFVPSWVTPEEAGAPRLFGGVPSPSPYSAMRLERVQHWTPRSLPTVEWANR